MASTIRPATEEEKGLARKVAQQLPECMFRDLIALGEEKYGLRVVSKRGDRDRMFILMPSGFVFEKDLHETDVQLDESIIGSAKKAGYTGDFTPNGEITSAVSYSRLIEFKESEAFWAKEL